MIVVKLYRTEGGLRTEAGALEFFGVPVREPDGSSWVGLDSLDLRTDPRELHNVYADPAHAATLAALKAELSRLRKELKDEDQFDKELPKDDVDTMTGP
jgi:hypothetical protein